MWVELGQYALVLAFIVAIVQGTLPWWGVVRGDTRVQAMARTAAFTQLGLLVLSFALLTLAFLQNDFSVDYIARQSNTLLPWWYKISAVWGGHEGSLLLWALVLALWTAAVARFSQALPLGMTARVLAILGLVSTAIISFILFTSNPFNRLFPDFPIEGNDLNPLLQDPGLIFHPPMLYMGYVGFAVPFAFAMAGLITGRLDSAWARWSRPWALAAWSFLTVGIALGSWWAYYELGWGGWWFWDPVENASFMPWLAGTALLHSLAVSEKRGVFKAWTVLLAIIAFSLSLLGTFLVRSGVLTSVHAFAADPTRGLYILGILMVVVGGSLSLFAWRGAALQRESNHGPFSREMFLLLNNLFLLTATVIVLLGTLFPLIADALELGKFSVGPPYFNLLFVPLTLLLLVFLGVGPSTNWKKQSADVILLPLRKVLLAAIVIAIGLPLIFFGDWPWHVGVTVGLCAWVLGSQLVDIARKTQHASTRRQGLKKLTRSYWGMQLAHLGLLVMVLGIAFTTTYSVEKDVRLAPGESITVNNYTFHFEGVADHQGPNYVAQRGTLIVSHDGFVETLHPEKRIYRVQQNPMTEAAISGNAFRDLYVALGEPLDAGAWAVRIYHKPMIRWIWFGALMMALGALLSMLDKRYRLKAAGGR
ncbi:heme lyase CcmF/NrfE family subunit [Perlucidibaca aquatica]|uniref:heme lyase CcmF/NrfE family subunit n=1 Tax=Perlucidibaca aquatica TaxID=1852776 RepID=UPI00083A0D60|nr:heme lyase CcmF/NrfE family subunit [Perlucidibaca aquatica]